MGVPNLFPWVRKNFPEQVRELKNNEKVNVDNLYLDANGLLHSAAQRVFGYGEYAGSLASLNYYTLTYKLKCEKVYELFFNEIKKIVSMTRPKKLVYIAIDGPAPLAKQAQQRQRRFVSSAHKTTFDSANITPGTLFMFRLTQYINYYIRFEMTVNMAWKPLKVIFSPPTDPGEGEHKIMDYIRKANVKNDVNCMFGPDADLIMLTLGSKLQRIFLLRESKIPLKYDYINISGIRTNLHSKFGMDDRSEYDIANDFILLGFFVGNDFLPRIQMFIFLSDGLDHMIDLYKYLIFNKGKGYYLTKNDKINNEGITEFIRILYTGAQGNDSIFKLRLNGNIIMGENQKLCEQNNLINNMNINYELKELFKNKTMEKYKKYDGDGQCFLDMEGYSEAYYGKQDDFYRRYNITPPDLIWSEDTSTSTLMSAAYLKSLVWIFEYYISGVPSWTYFYNYHYPPLMKDLLLYLVKTKDINIKFDKSSPLLPFEQLMSVLPPKSADLLPEEYRVVFKDEKLLRDGIYDEKFQVDYEGKDREHLGIVLLPFVETKKIKEIYNKIKPKEVYNRNRFTPSYIFEYTNNYNVKFTSYFGTLDLTHIKRIELN